MRKSLWLEAPMVPGKYILDTTINESDLPNITRMNIYEWFVVEKNTLWGWDYSFDYFDQEKPLSSGEGRSEFKKAFFKRILKEYV